MPWKIERKHDHVAVVTMNTNKVNAQNPAFFADLHAAFDRLDPDEACRRANPTHDFLKNRRLGSAS
jgi:enoyl-CoA hydratase/carnithine racemase